jgi:hypothetical protein
MRSVMVTLAGLLVGVFVFGTLAHAQRPPANEQQAARIALVQEFVRELEFLYRSQEIAKKEFDEEPSASGKVATSVRVGTRTLLQMNESINRLNMITGLAERWAQIRDSLKEAHQQRIQIVQEVNEMSKAILSGPTPGVNYGQMTARAPELTAYMEQLDKTLFTVSQAMFFALVDEDRVGKDGNLHHLLLTKKERASMVQSIDKGFGPTLGDNNASYVVSAAWAINYGLTRPIYKSADEP